jgi:polyphosphate kinase
MNTVKSKLNLLNRELGVIEFNRRVLAQAQNQKAPILERLKFICIVASNLDEFFEIASGLRSSLLLEIDNESIQ